MRGANRKLTPENSLLCFFLKYFGDNTHQIMESYPIVGSDEPNRTHIEMGSPEHTAAALGNFELIDSDNRLYAHPCWCNPQLIYVDDVRGNEVWLHNRDQ